jgi:hypothetical protein
LWLPYGSAVAPRAGERVPIRSSDGYMRLEIDGKVVANATQRTGGWW